MGIFDVVSTSVRAISEGKSMAKAQRLAESCLGVRLPKEVALDGNKYALRMVDVSSIEKMAIEYINSYGRYLIRDFDDLPQERKISAKETFTKAAKNISYLQNSGVEFESWNLVPFLDLANALGSDTSAIKKTW